MHSLLLSPKALLDVFLFLNKKKKFIDLFLIIVTCKGLEKKNEMNEGIH